MSLFITFEGIDGSGKSTQAQRLSEQLRARGYAVLLTREPGGTRISEQIRNILVDLNDTEMQPVTEALLFAAARAQLVTQRIRPFLKAGGIVVCDRYIDSTFAYQGYGLHINLEQLQFITTMATGGLHPDLTIYLDIVVEESMARKLAARQQSTTTANSDLQCEWNRLDARDPAYYQRVAAGFHALIAAEPERWRCFNAHESEEALAHAITTTVEPFLTRVAQTSCQ
ncbi:MAG: dTMP kinase [Chloroflexaceae bacterium]|nr:dTMP kinase [Chloroflexaceae bacterium]